MSLQKIAILLACEFDGLSSFMKKVKILTKSRRIVACIKNNTASNMALLGTI
ncbi:MAG: hypothetical protein KBF76_14175 [Verrucomicrobiales bacterium]|nr:hypothetical protein [Verrucomicrobiales bacterium]HQZ28941.1 hypothetical protein [Verrucomicrobiales bacterium]